MRFLKKEICLNISVQTVVIVLSILVILFAAYAISQSNLPMNLRFVLLRPENISSINIYSGRAAQFQHITDKQMIKEIISSVKEVRLSGKPYKLSLVGGNPVWYQIDMKYGQDLILGGAHTDEYFYFLDGEYYYVCNDETAKESKDLPVWKSLEKLHEQQVNAIFPGT